MKLKTLLNLPPEKTRNAYKSLPGTDDIKGMALLACLKLGWILIVSAGRATADRREPTLDMADKLFSDLEKHDL